MSDRKKSVFISYSRDDIGWASRLVADLKRHPLEIWFDQDRLLPGQLWQQKIQAAIRRCTFFIVLLSKNSVSKRGTVQREINTALEILEESPEGEIFIIPVRIDDCKPSHHKIRKLHWVDLFRSYSNGVRKIIQAMELEPPPAPATLIPTRPSSANESYVDFGDAVFFIRRNEFSSDRTTLLFLQEL